MNQQPLTGKPDILSGKKGKSAGVRPFVEKDIPVVAKMFREIFLDNDEDLFQLKEPVLRELLLNSYWDDEQLSSLVYEERDGSVKGFLGGVHRPMRIGDRPLNAAVSYNLMVDPGSRSSMAGIQLLKTFLSGPQDLSLVDSANTTARKLWESMGAELIPMHSIYWKYPLQPFRFSAHYLKKRSWIGPAVRMMSPLFSAADYLTGMLSRLFSPNDHSGRIYSKEISVDMLKDCMKKYSRKKAVAPAYTRESLQWILNLAQKATLSGDLKREGVFNHQDNLLGWMIYYKNPGGISEILQVKSIPGKEKQVLNHLFEKIKKQGAREISGRLDPEHIEALSEKFCLYIPGRMWMLVHSNDEKITSAFKSGDLYISRLEGDMWVL